MEGGGKEDCSQKRGKGKRGKKGSLSTADSPSSRKGLLPPFRYCTRSERDPCGCMRKEERGGIRKYPSPTISRLALGGKSFLFLPSLNPCQDFGRFGSAQAFRLVFFLRGRLLLFTGVYCCLGHDVCAAILASYRRRVRVTWGDSHYTSLPPPHVVPTRQGMPPAYFGVGGCGWVSYYRVYDASFGARAPRERKQSN